jgi:hypothetical protein
MRMRGFTFISLLATAAAFVGCYTARPSPPQAGDAIVGELHRSIFVRADESGHELGDGLVDPLLWVNSKYLLTEPRYSELCRLLGEIGASDPSAIDPVQRALTQHELWTVLDWTDGREAPNANALRPMLARAIQRLALTSAGAASLPDNFAATVRAETFPSAYDDSNPQRPYLPPDLFDPKGSWVCITMPRRASGVIATHHANQFSRSAFLVFFNLHGGRQATIDYLQTLSMFPRPFELAESPFGTLSNGTKLRNDAIEPARDLPQFPAGTQVALVRRMLVLDSAGNPMPTPIVQSIQLRVYRKIAPANMFVGRDARQYQIFFEFALQRPDKLRAVQPDEPAYITLMGITGSEDQFEAPAGGERHRFMMPVLETCAACHERGGIYSVNSVVAARFGPLDLNPQPTPTTPNEEIERAIASKRRRHDMGLLQGLMQAR